MGFSIDVEIRAPETGGRRAVVADADAARRGALARHLAGRGFQVSQTDGALDALDLIGREAPLVALLCHDHDGDEGDRAAALAAMLYPQTRILMMAGDAAGSGEDSGPFSTLRRPVDGGALDRWLDEAVE